MITETNTRRNNNTNRQNQISTLGYRTRTRIGNWNIRTLTETSRLAQVEKEMKRYHIEILGLSEVRWKNSGEINTSNGNYMIFSGRDDTHEQGVGILTTNKAKKALMEWKPVNSRIIVARFHSKIRNTTIIQCYAPTEDADETTKDEFYEQLQATLASTHRNDVKIIQGDLNAKIGTDNTDLTTVMGKNALDSVRNNNGERLVDFCITNQLFIGGSRFPHKNIHKYTWTSPDGRTKNQIDHVMVNKKFLTSLQDVRTMRGADVHSDHQLVIAQFQIKPAAVKHTKTNRRKFNTNRLRNIETNHVFNETLQLNLHRNEATSIEQRWNQIEGAYIKTASDVLGYQEHNRKPWISDDTWNKIEERRQLKIQMHQHNTAEVKHKYEEIARQIKKMARNDRRQFSENILKDAEEAAAIQNMRALHQCVRKVTGKITNIPPIKDANGQILTTDEAQLKRWKKYFEEDVIDSTENLWSSIDTNNETSNTHPPTEREVKSVIEKLKNNKAAGTDNITAEIFKGNPSTTASTLTPIIQEVWNSGKIPQKWKEGLTITIPKKGDLRECKNWRGISLLNTTIKILAMIILDRISPTINAKLRNEQAGFRPGRSCTDHINSIRIITEQSNEWNSPLYLLFVDFERAFDTINRNAIWQTLHEMGIPKKLIELIQEMYRDAGNRVQYKGKQSGTYYNNQGVRQGCVLSPTLFLIVLDGIMRKLDTTSPNGIQWGLTGRLNDLDYADDICLLSHKHSDMQQKVQQLSDLANEVGLKINIRKTKIMRFNTNITTPIHINDIQIEDVNEFVYLGCTVAKTGGTEEDINKRINKARHTFNMLHKVWNTSVLSRKTKIRMFNSCVKSVLLYGCETWKHTEKIRKKLQVFINKCLRRLLKCFWPNVISNIDLHRKTNQSDIATEIKRRKWRWIGHTLRKPSSDITRMSLDWNPQGKRKIGRPAMTWKRTMLAEAKQLGKSWEEIKAVAPNRVRWSSLVDVTFKLTFNKKNGPK